MGGWKGWRGMGGDLPKVSACNLANLRAQVWLWALSLIPYRQQKEKTRLSQEVLLSVCVIVLGRGIWGFSALSASVSHLLPHPEIKLGSLGEPGTVQTCQTCLHPFCFSRFLQPSFSLKFIGVSVDSSGRSFPRHLWWRRNEESRVSSFP